jgi:hypothetical protein
MPARPDTPSDTAYHWCIANRRHYWVPVAGESGVVGAARVIRWRLTCQHCDSTASEWRDLLGYRVPGTQRQYYLGDGYRRALADITPGEAFLTLSREQGAAIITG